MCTQPVLSESTKAEESQGALGPGVLFYFLELALDPCLQLARAPPQCSMVCVCVCVCVCAHVYTQ